MADQEVELTEVRLVLTLGIKLDAEKIAKQATPEQVFELVKELDNEVGLWALTILLYRYFEAQMSLARTHAPELVDLSDEELLAEFSEEDDSEGEPNTPAGPE